MGLNSGRVIAGEIGSGSLGYGAIGEQVGMAQRIGAPGGDAVGIDRAAGRTVMLGVRIKGTDDPVCAGWRWRQSSGAPTPLGVGRRQEMATLDGMADQALGGHGGVVNLVGPPGHRKSRTAREAAAAAAGRSIKVAFCEIPRGAVPRGDRGCWAGLQA